MDEIAHLGSWLAARRLGRRQFLGEAAILGLSTSAVGAVISACETGAPSGRAAAQPLTIGMNTTWDVLDPQATTGTVSAFTILNNLFDGLFTIGTDGTVVPALATHEEISPDGLTHTYTIRTGVEFHDGTPLTADDVKYTFDRVLLDPSFVTPYRSDISNIASVTTAGPTKVIFSLKKPDPILRNTLYLPVALIVPKAYTSRIGKAEFASHPIGTGPYRFDSAVAGQYVKLTVNDKYWGTKGTIPSATFKPVPEVATRLSLLQAGGADIVSDLDPTQAATATSAGAHTTSVYDGASFFVGFRGSDSPLKDVRVRQALNYAVNRKAIVTSIYRGYAELLTSLVTPEQPGGKNGIPQYSYDPNKAKQLLQAAAFDTNAILDLVVPIGRYLLGDTAAQAMVSDFAAVGVKVKQQNEDYGQWGKDLTSKNIRDMTLDSATNRVLDPITPIRGAVGSSGGFSLWADPVLDAKLDAAAQLMGQTRVKAIEDVAAYMHDNPPGVFLWELPIIFGIRRGVTWKPRAGTRTLYLADVSSS